MFVAIDLYGFLFLGIYIIGKCQFYLLHLSGS
jgi:hypothetical protein